MLYGFLVFALLTVVCFGKAFTHSIVRLLWYVAAVALGFMAGVGLSIVNPVASNVWWATWVIVCVAYLGWLFWDSMKQRARGL